MTTVHADHPRSRGVYKPLRLTNNRMIGSSPLARGLLVISVVLMVCLRIIPARAGFTYRDGELFLAAGDHPRSRGVYRPRTAGRP